MVFWFVPKSIASFNCEIFFSFLNFLIFISDILDKIIPKMYNLNIQILYISNIEVRAMGKYHLNANLINVELQKQGLTEKQLAEKMDVSIKRLRKYLYSDNYAYIPYAIYYRLLKILNLSFEQIIIENSN